MEYFRAFITGGIICGLSQILIDKTRLTPARILTLYVVLGVILTGLGWYQPLMEWGGAGASVPLLGFGCNLAKGVREGLLQDGLLGAFTGGVTAAAGGIAAAVVFGWLTAVLFHSRDKN